MTNSRLQAFMIGDIKAAWLWPWQLKVLLFGLITAGGVAIGASLWVMPAQQQLVLMAQTDAALKTRYQRQLAALGDMTLVERRLEQATESRDDLLAALPAHISAADFVQAVTRLGTANKLVFSSFTVGEPESEPLLAALPFSLLLRGRYQDFIGFLNALGTLEQPVMVRDFDMRPHAETPQLLELKIDAKALHRSADPRHSPDGAE